MLDIQRTLDPRTGIARYFAVARPRPPLDLLWQTVVELDGAGDLPPSARYVGAYGHSRADVLLRGAGEAVERAALHPARGALPGTVHGRRPSAAPAFDDPGVALAAPGALDGELTWYPARRLRDGTTVPVPAPLVDWPVGDGGGAFDPGPSCAASGAGPDMAVRGALLEMIERDAVLVAWERGLRLPTVDLTGAHPALATARRLIDTARAAGTRVVVAAVPTAVPGVTCCVAVAVDDTAAAIAAVGCKVSPTPANAVLGAVQEALQIRTLLLIERGDRPPPAAPARIVGERDRVTWMLSRDGAATVCAWADGFTAPRPLPAGADPDTRDLIARLVADGADPLLVDLTPRLPDPLRAMGWAAVKVIPVGYQHLRMNEELPWTRNRPRLATAGSRTGLTPTFAVGEGRRPHPLP